MLVSVSEGTRGQSEEVVLKLRCLEVPTGVGNHSEWCCEQTLSPDAVTRRCHHPGGLEEPMEAWSPRAKLVKGIGSFERLVRQEPEMSLPPYFLSSFNCLLSAQVQRKLGLRLHPGRGAAGLGARLGGISGRQMMSTLKPGVSLLFVSKLWSLVFILVLSPKLLS